MKISKTLARCISKHASSIVTVMGIASAVLAVGGAVYGTVETCEDIRESHDTKKIIVKAVSHYAGAAGALIGTTMCFVYLNKYHKLDIANMRKNIVKMQSSMDKVISQSPMTTEVGKGAAAIGAGAVSIFAGEKLRKKPDFDDKLCENADSWSEKIRWVYCPWTDSWFQASYSDVVAAEYDANQRMAEYGQASIATLLGSLRNPAVNADIERGWDCDRLSGDYRFVWIPFYNRKAYDDEHGYYTIMDCAVEPLPFEILENV